MGHTFSLVSLGTKVFTSIKRMKLGSVVKILGSTQHLPFERYSPLNPLIDFYFIMLKSSLEYGRLYLESLFKDYVSKTSPEPSFKEIITNRFTQSISFLTTFLWQQTFKIRPSSCTRRLSRWLGGANFQLLRCSLKSSKWLGYVIVREKWALETSLFLRTLPSSTPEPIFVALM